MSRSIWKKLNIDKFLITKKFLTKTQKKIWSRSSTIPFSLIGKKILIYNGIFFKRLYINREKVGYKFGEFSYTRKHTKKLKLKKNGSKK